MFIIDGATNTASVIPGSTAATDIAINAVAKKAYAFAGNNVQVIGASGSITSTVSVGEGVILGSAVNPSKNKVYITIKTTSGYSIKMIDGTSDTVIGTLPWDGPLDAWALNPVTDKLYIGSTAPSNTGCVRIVDGSTMTETSQIAIPTQAKRIVVNPANNKVYASMADRGTAVIDGQIIAAPRSRSRGRMPP